METWQTTVRPSTTGVRVSVNSPEPCWRRLGNLGLAAILVGGVLVACSPGSAPASQRADVPLQAGKQTTLVNDAMGVSEMGVDADKVLYLAGLAGISTMAPGAAQPIKLKLDNQPVVSTLAVAPDGTLSFGTLDGAVETIKPGSTTLDPLPFGNLRQRSQIAVAQDGTVYLGDNEHNKLLTLAPGATAPTELPVAGVRGMGHMVIDPDDNVYVSMMGEIMKITKGGTTADPVVGVTDDAGGLAVDAAGNLYATDVKAGTVSRMPAAGGEWVRLPFTGLQSPTDITVDGEGNVYVMNRLGSEIARLAAK